MELSLPLPPSANHYYRCVGGATLISREGRGYRQTVGAALAAMRVTQLRGRLWVRVTLYPPDCRRRDLDNALKCLLDALAHGGVYADDSQIDHLDIQRGPVTPGGGVHVVVTEV
jgi:crossover junction endodeoxyribonuclease RusA